MPLWKTSALCRPSHSKIGFRVDHIAAYDFWSHCVTFETTDKIPGKVQPWSSSLTPFAGAMAAKLRFYFRKEQ
jgi:hypothetical protein